MSIEARPRLGGSRESSLESPRPQYIWLPPQVGRVGLSKTLPLSASSPVIISNHFTQLQGTFLFT